jgi:lysyl-tRNA synthetase, class II
LSEKKKNAKAKTGLERTETELIRIRRDKRDAIREAGGNPYPNDFRPENTAGEIVESFGDMSKEELENINDSFKLAGRLILKRDFGKASFAHIQDATGKIQVFFQKDTMGEAFKAVKKYDVGDIIGVVGTPFRTKTDELTISVTESRLLVKGLRPLPEKWHGLTDVETRYRRRYIDLLVNPDVRKVFEKRSRLVNAVRAFFMDKDYIEVETPMLHQVVGGATAEPFVTHHKTLHMDLFLRIAPELYLKRLLVGGMDKVFEINKNFRNEGISTQHNPEFTMLEFYRAFATFNDLMQITEELFCKVAEEIAGGVKIVYQENEIDFTPPWERISVFDATIKYGGVDEAVLKDEAKMREFAKGLEIPVEKKWGWGKLLIEIFEKTAEDKLKGPVFITDYPSEVSPLSRPFDDNPDFVERFELFIAGMEIANGFSELNDPDEQKIRFERQLEMGEFGEGVREYDRDYIMALEYGMPPAAGEGIGIDRMAMIFTDSPSIREVILFPQLKEKEVK